jgi:putative membrane protein
LEPGRLARHGADDAGVLGAHSLGHRPVEDLSDPPVPADRALRILDERFARGEIDADEYDLRRGVLRSP